MVSIAAVGDRKVRVMAQKPVVEQQQWQPPTTLKEGGTDREYVGETAEVDCYHYGNFASEEGYFVNVDDVVDLE